MSKPPPNSCDTCGAPVQFAEVPLLVCSYCKRELHNLLAVQATNEPPPEENLKERKPRGHNPSPSNDKGSALTPLKHETAELLFTLEQHLRWEASAPEWKEQRVSWLAELARADTMFFVRQSLLELEARLKNKYFKQQWLQKHRNPWMDELAKCTRQREWAASVLLLEEQLLPKAFRPEWTSLRPAWIERVRDYGDGQEERVVP